MRQQQFQQQMQTINDTPLNEILKDNAETKKMERLVKEGRVSSDTLALFNVITHLADYNISAPKNSKADMNIQDYNKIKKLDNTVFNNADFYIEESGFTVIDKKSGIPFKFETNFNFYDLEANVKACNLHKEVEDRILNARTSDAKILDIIVKSYISDGGLSKKEIEAIGASDKVLDKAEIIVGSEKITTVGYGGVKSSTNNPNYRH